jgi:hypothetical protein
MRFMESARQPQQARASAGKSRLQNRGEIPRVSERHPQAGIQAVREHQ